MTDWALDLGKVDVYHCITMQSEYLLTSCSIYHNETVYGEGIKLTISVKEVYLVVMFQCILVIVQLY